MERGVQDEMLIRQEVVTDTRRTLPIRISMSASREDNISILRIIIRLTHAARSLFICSVAVHNMVDLPKPCASNMSAVLR